MTDLARFLGELRRDGYTVTKARSSHWHIRDDSGHLVAVAGSTASDHRSLRNLRRDIRRAERNTR